MTPPPRETVEPTLATEADVATLVAGFEECSLPYPNWTHRAHLAVAVCYLRQFPFPAALNRIRERIQLYSRTRGSGVGYNETITTLFMRAVADYLERHPGVGAAAAVDESAKWYDMAWVRRHYSAERLDSAEAKTGWVEPDVRPLDF